MNEKRSCHDNGNDNSLTSPLALACAYVRQWQSPQKPIAYLGRNTKVSK